MALCADDRFGPYAGPLCRGGFDFSLLFEESILIILPSALLLILAPLRLFLLRRKGEALNGGRLYLFKAVSVAPGDLSAVSFRFPSPPISVLSGTKLSIGVHTASVLSTPGPAGA